MATIQSKMFFRVHDGTCLKRWISMSIPNEYQPKGGDALRLMSTDKEWFVRVCGWQVKLCDPINVFNTHMSKLYHS